MKLSKGEAAGVGGVFLAAAIVLGSLGEFRGFGVSDEQIQVIMIDTVEGWSKAEKDIFGSKPDNPDDPVGPHPDPDKCICQGTGKIVQGDGHVSPCPYHGASLDDNASEEEVCSCGCGKAGCDCQKRNRGLFNFR